MVLVPVFSDASQGMNDGLMPIEDSILLLQHGSPKASRLETPD